MPLFRIAPARRCDSADEVALGIVSFEDPIRGARRPMKKDLAKSRDPQLQSAVVISKMDPTAIVAKAIGAYCRALHQAVIADKNLDGISASTNRRTRTRKSFADRDETSPSQRAAGPSTREGNRTCGASSATGLAAWLS